MAVKGSIPRYCSLTIINFSYPLVRISPFFLTIARCLIHSQSLLPYATLSLSFFVAHAYSFFLACNLVCDKTKWMWTKSPQSDKKVNARQPPNWLSLLFFHPSIRRPPLAQKLYKICLAYKTFFAYECVYQVFIMSKYTCITSSHRKFGNLCLTGLGIVWHM